MCQSEGLLGDIRLSHGYLEVEGCAVLDSSALWPQSIFRDRLTHIPQWHLFKEFKVLTAQQCLTRICSHD